MKTRIIILSVLALTGSMVYGAKTYVDNGDGTVTRTELVVVDKVAALEQKNHELLQVQGEKRLLAERTAILDAMEQEILAEIVELQK